MAIIRLFDRESKPQTEVITEEELNVRKAAYLAAHPTYVPLELPPTEQQTSKQKTMAQTEPWHPDYGKSAFDPRAVIIPTPDAGMNWSPSRDDSWLFNDEEPIQLRRPRLYAMKRNGPASVLTRGEDILLSESFKR